jgi:hypothetical protein
MGIRSSGWLPRGLPVTASFWPSASATARKYARVGLRPILTLKIRGYMSGSWATVVSLVGGVAAAILGVVVGGMVTRRAQNEQWLRDTQTETYAKFLQAYARVEEQLRSSYFMEQSANVDWSSYSASLTSLSLIASEDVSAIAAKLAEAMANYAEFIETREPHTDKERALRQTLAQTQIMFVNAARQTLGLRQLPVPWPLGGPPPDRPVPRDPRSNA